MSQQDRKPDRKPASGSAPRAKSGGATRGRARGSRGVAVVRWSALALLLFAMGTWTWLIVQGAGQVAAAVLAENPQDAPVDVLAAPRVLEPGHAADLDTIERELRSAGYQPVARTPRAPGEYRRDGDRLELYRREHFGPAGDVKAAWARVAFSGGHVVSIERGDGRSLGALALEPVRLGAFRGPVLAERKPLPLNRFPRRLVDAVMAAEDARFLKHGGIDPVGILRAIVSDLRGKGPMQGGSTITQQVIKNRVVGKDRTLLRKAHEAVLASYVEGRVSKERLLEIYLNEVYLGQRGAVSVVGMPAASMFYFGRNVNDLALHQAAMLAGMIASPGRFDPRHDPDEARARLRWVLGRMTELGMITAAEAESAGRADFGLAPLEDPLDPAGDVLDAVHRELEARGYDPRPSQERAQVHTTLDVELQAAARRALDETLRDLEKQDPRRTPLDGAVVILDPKTGELRAIVGGRTGARGGFHRALDALRQPGSAFKPFVALAAFANGQYRPSSSLEDAPLTVGSGRSTWSPVNYDHAFRGTVTLRQALEQSLNVPMVRVGLAVGPSNVVQWAHRAGLGDHLPSHPSVVLGAGEVRPIDLAVGYGALASLGVRRVPVLVRAVRSGVEAEKVALKPPAAPATALPPEACWMVLDCLAGVVEHGTGKDLAPVLGGVRVAGKTGTTQDGRDAWFALVTGKAVVIVYLGRDDDRPAHLTGAGAAVPVVKRLLELAGPRLIAPLPGAPEQLRIVEIDPETGGRANPSCPTRVNEVFAPGTEPPPCTRHGSFLRRFWDRLTGKNRAESGRRDDVRRR